MAEFGRILGPSEFQFQPPQLQYLRNSCLLQYIPLVTRNFWTWKYVLIRTKVLMITHHHIKRNKRYQIRLEMIGCVE